MNEITVRVFDIVWDTDGQSPKKLKLPTEVEIICNPEDLDDECYLADVLSDNFGWCVDSLDYEVVER